MRMFASLVLCLVLAAGTARAQVLLTVKGCGAPISAQIENEADFANIDADPVQFCQVAAPKFLAAIGALCRTSPKQQALVASRVTSIVFTPAPGGEEDVTAYLLGKTLHLEILDPAYHAGPFRKVLAAALEKGPLAPH
jgi:hypothetical protein